RICDSTTKSDPQFRSRGYLGYVQWNPQGGSIRLRTTLGRRLRRRDRQQARVAWPTHDASTPGIRRAPNRRRSLQVGGAASSRLQSSPNLLARVVDPWGTLP